MQKQLRVGVIGMGGWAAVLHDTLLKLENEGECRLICISSTDIGKYKKRMQKLRLTKRGVQIFTNDLQMLDTCRSQLDVVVIPTPIQLHARMHRACVERGLPAYLEKPPTLDHAELEEMIAVEARAARETYIPFNYIVEAQRQALKKRLSDGEFGAVKLVRVSGFWPRGDQYYNRTSWAGRLILDDAIVLDSCMGNAMAHLVHNALFWCGTDALWSWGQVQDVSAELYRANAIEGADTAFVQAKTTQGPELRLAMSHACENPQYSEEIIECEQARIQYDVNFQTPEGHAQRYVIRYKNGENETRQTTGLDLVADNLRAYFNYLRGQISRPMTRLVDCRPFVHLNDLAYIAAGGIGTIPEQAIKHWDDSGKLGPCRAIQNLNEIAKIFLEAGQFPSRQGVAWALPAGRATLNDLPKFGDTIRKIAAAGAKKK